VGFETGEGLKFKNTIRVVKGMLFYSDTGKVASQYYYYIHRRLAIQGIQRKLSSKEDKDNDIIKT
jgi:hypothetical protein